MTTMPDRSYSPPDPVRLSRRDHVKAHPDRAAFSLVSILVGGLLIAATAIPGFVPSPSVESLPMRTAVATATLLGAGGAATFWGSITLSSDILLIWRTLRTGLFALWVGWLSYSLTVMTVYPESIIAWLTALGMSTVFFIHFWATRREDNLLRKLRRLLHLGD